MRVKYDLNNNKGITIVALVVTTIALLILSAVGINGVVRRKWNYKSSTGS